MDDEIELSDRDWFLKQWNETSVPLSAAVLWIATNGAIETEHVVATREAISRAQRTLITSLSDGDIAARGNPEGKVNERTDVPSGSFDCGFSPIGEPLPLSDVFDDDSDPTLRWGALGEIDWRRRDRRGDTIENCYFVIWTRLSVEKSDVLKLWPRARRGDLVAELDRDQVERYRVKGSFDAEWWTLDQVAVWATSRSRDLVEIAGEHPEHGSLSTRNLAIRSATALAAAGMESRSEPFSTGYAESFLLQLLEQGRLNAFGRLPGETISRQLSPRDWAGLKIAEGQDTGRLGVWRREPIPHGAGDLLHVRVDRDDVLREFAQIEERAPVSDPTMSDNDLEAWIRAKEGELGRKPPARTWKECPELESQGVTKPRFEAVLKTIYPNPRKGRPPKSEMP